MGQKVHPLGFRLGITQKHQSYWCTNPKTSAVWIDDASFLRRFIQKAYIDAGITNIEIHRRELDCSSLTIKIYAARPAVFLRNLKSVDSLRDQLIQKLKAFYRKRTLPDPGKIQINLSIEPLEKPVTLQLPVYLQKKKKLNSEDIQGAYAALLAEKLVEDLQQRKPYRAAIRRIIEKATDVGVKGIKVQISGRLNGAEIARSEEVRKGAVPLQTLRADIDYSSKSAKTIYGLLGVKVWVFRGERLNPLTNF